ncbi:MAG: hypothetical protein MJ200_02925 [Mycoplasmoidaceae bacterium]|nr:hypothetical protein [Mycoplasmoidaceae bacterium]
MPFTTIGASVFGSMFSNSGLENIPYSLLRPRKDSEGIDTVTIEGGNALQSMFNNCINITSIPEDLFAYFNPTQYGQDRTCYLMFNNCSGLKGNLPDKLLSNLPAGDYCFANMFSHCTNITGVGERFLAPVGAVNMCDNMFADCPSLVNLPTHLMNTDTPISGSFTKQFYHMFYECGSIVEIPKGFLSNSVKSLGSQACMEMFSGSNGSNVRRINAFLPFTNTTAYASQSVEGIFGTNEKNVEYIDPDFFKNLNVNITFGSRCMTGLFRGMGTYYDKDGTTILGKWEITQVGSSGDDPDTGYLFMDLTGSTATTAAFPNMFSG